MKDEERLALLASCEQLESGLAAEKVKVKGDYRDNYSPGWKFNHWELKVNTALTSVYEFLTMDGSCTVIVS
jgi:hypothetical protein